MEEGCADRSAVAFKLISIQGAGLGPVRCGVTGPPLAIPSFSGFVLRASGPLLSAILVSDTETWRTPQVWRHGILAAW